MKYNSILILLLVSVITFPSTSAAHFITGYVDNAADGTSPNGRIVRVWNVTNGDSVNGTIGPSGASLTSNVFLVDCELFSNPCVVGDVLNVTVWDDGSGYAALNNTQVTVTGAGFDVAANTSMNSPPNVSQVFVDDVLLSPTNELDLTPATTTLINCSGVVQERESLQDLNAVTAELYATSTSSFGGSDDNNDHYTNNSCTRNDAYGGSDETLVNCTFAVQYYANPGGWECTINTTDIYNAAFNNSDTTTMNSMLSVGANTTINFGPMNPNELSPELDLQLINYGNVDMNITLSGYANETGDGDAMWCPGSATNITIGYLRYNMTGSNAGSLTLTQSDAVYTNASATPVKETVNYRSRDNDVVNDVINLSYWRIYVPGGISGACRGNILVGALQG